MRTLLRSTVVVVTCLALGACVVRVREVRVDPLATDRTTAVGTPVKAHLLDGGTVVYATGVDVTDDALLGRGIRYDLRLREVGPVDRIPLDSVAGMVNFRTGINAPASVALTVPATALGALGLSGLMVAIFGSCPTVYSDTAGVQVLEAEGFSYSIAPLFERRDLDRLGARPDARGALALEIRNEALETHHLNHLELVEVRHRPDELVMPDPDGRPLALAALRAPLTATDRAGRDQLATLAAADDRLYATAPHLVAAASADDLRDHVDLVFPAPVGADSAAVVLRLRNSLLTTILLYDVMLGSQGAGALDWLGRDMEQVGSVLELGQWYNRHMGMRVSVWENGAYRQVARIGDTGPIAWKDVAAMVPVPAGDSLRVRLSFVTDGWRIDRAALAAEARRPEARAIAASRITNAEERDEPEALRHVRDPDEAYLETTPGQRFTLHFETGAPDPERPATYLLASQGYYTEWIRTGWIRSASEPARFRPTDEMLLEAVRKWHDQRDGFEEQFYATRIPVR